MATNHNVPLEASCLSPSSSVSDVTLARAMGAKGLIAIRDANAPQGQDWQLLPGAATALTPAPSYLVWISPPGDPDEYPRPYQMVAIELISSSDALAGLDADGSKPGHELFVTQCLKCHAIYGVGGSRSMAGHKKSGAACP